MERIIIIHVFLLILFFTESVKEVLVQENNMPVTIVKPKFDARTLPAAIFISGDGGWNKFEQEIADSLAGLGIPTIGLDTKKYFWNRRTPEETASDIASSINKNNRIWQRESFLFIGYSLGAELVPFIANRLPEPVKTKISMLVLLSPAPTTDFEVHFTDMLGINSRHDSYKVIEEISRIKTIPVLLIFGAEEKTKVPAMLTGEPVKLITVPGDHTYNHDSSLILEVMKTHNALSGK